MGTADRTGLEQDLLCPRPCTDVDRRDSAEVKGTHHDPEFDDGELEEAQV